MHVKLIETISFAAMPIGSYGVIVGEEYNGAIVWRTREHVIDINDANCYWSPSNLIPLRVRPLQSGDKIEITI